MTKKHREKITMAYTNVKPTKFFVITAIIFLALLVGAIIYFSNFSIKSHRYVIKNKYYGFELQTPKNWIAEEKSFYSNDTISRALAECKTDKKDSASIRGVGDFRFKSYKYPQDLGISGFSQTNLPSGIILEITVDCVPDSIKNNVESYTSGNTEVGGEKALSSLLDSAEFGGIKQYSLLHGDFRYNISEYIYIAPADKQNSEESLKNNYSEMFDKIISSFKFSK